MNSIRVVLNQCGAALELHGVADNPVTLLLLSPSRLEYYRAVMVNDNPDMQHASIGQVAMFAAKRIVQSITDLDPKLYTFNASENKYYAL